MIEFHPVTLSDKPWVDEIVFNENSPSADFNFGNIYIWDKHYLQSVCRLGKRMLTVLRYEEQPVFAFPIGTGPLRPAIEAMREYAAAEGCPFVMYGVTELHRSMLEAEYPGRFVFEYDPDEADYIYSAEKLSSFSGKALHAKKNHCNRFEAENEWEFLPITREMIPSCLDMLSRWSLENEQRLDESISFEHDAILLAFEEYEQLGFEGGVLYANGELVGFSFGEFSSEDTFDVHFEKADSTLNGAYTMVCRELTRMLLARHPALRYMNREDDVGLESLRKSKLSYKPEYILKKYSAVWVD